MSADEFQLLANFREGFDLRSNQVLTLDKPSTNVDESKPWCRFSIQPGDKVRTENGGNPTYLQLGGIFLQVFVPKKMGASAGNDLIEQFENLFTDWTSSDGALVVKRMTRRLEERPDMYVHVIRFAYESLRKRAA